MYLSIWFYPPIHLSIHPSPIHLLIYPSMTIYLSVYLYSILSMYCIMSICMEMYVIPPPLSIYLLNISIDLLTEFKSNLIPTYTTTYEPWSLFRQRIQQIQRVRGVQMERTERSHSVWCGLHCHLCPLQNLYRHSGTTYIWTCFLKIFILRISNV